MNRLWVRLSIYFGLTIITVSLLPFLVLNILNVLGIIEMTLPTELVSGDPEQIALFFERFVYREMLRIVFGAALTGIVAGVFISRIITRPLRQLEEGTLAIGAQNLDFRVDLQEGSDEIMAVARSFNQMADHLQRAENQRQNLLADVAHELRTPLTVLQGNLRGILDEVFPLEKAEIARLFDQTRHLTHLVNDLHELAQAEAQRLSLNRVDIDLPDLLQDAAAAFRPLAEEKRVQLRVELLGKLPLLNADLDRLRQSLNNLINNGLLYTPAGGCVTVQAECMRDGAIEIRVIDDGIGIKQENLPNVFDRFYRGDPSRQRIEDDGGTGLGLAIVRAVTEMHGGSVSVDSDGPGKGSRFTLRFNSDPINRTRS